MKIRLLFSGANIDAEHPREVTIQQTDVIENTIKAEWPKVVEDDGSRRTFRVILQGRILPLSQTWKEASRNMLTENMVVHVFAIVVPSEANTTNRFECVGQRPSGHPDFRPSRAEEPLWNTVYVLRLRRAIARGSPSILCNSLWLLILSMGWMLYIRRPLVFDSFSRGILYIFTVVSAFSIIDKLVRSQTQS